MLKKSVIQKKFLRLFFGNKLNVFFLSPLTEILLLDEKGGLAFSNHLLQNSGITSK